MTVPAATRISLPWDAADPYAFYARKCVEGPVVWDGNAHAWLILSYPVAQRILADNHGWTSNPLANPAAAATLGSLGGEGVFSRSMLSTDGATHQRLRGCVRDVFTRNFISGLNTGVQAISTELGAGLPTATEFDFMADFALPFPLAVAAAWLGLDQQTTELLREESPAISRLLNDITDTDTVVAAAGSFAALLFELIPVAAERRKYPEDDLLSYIAADTRLELDDVVVTALLIAVAGHETTANLLGSAMFRLCSPPQSTTVDTTDAGFVNELLRLDGPVQAVARTATQDHVIEGVRIDVHQTALVVIAAANRDPDVFDNPAAFHPSRRGPAPLSFGHGPHYCIGAALARLDIITALRQILPREPYLADQPTWRDTRAIRGPLTLPIALGKD